MKIKNTSTKIISIGAKMMLPDAVIDISNEVYNTPGVKALVGKNMLSPVIETVEHIPAPVAEETAPAAETAEVPVVEAVAKKTTTRKSTSK